MGIMPPDREERLKRIFRRFGIPGGLGKDAVTEGEKPDVVKEELASLKPMPPSAPKSKKAPHPPR